MSGSSSPGKRRRVRNTTARQNETPRSFRCGLYPQVAPYGDKARYRAKADAEEKLIAKKNEKLPLKIAAKIAVGNEDLQIGSGQTDERRGNEQADRRGDAALDRALY